MSNERTSDSAGRSNATPYQSSSLQNTSVPSAKNYFVEVSEPTLPDRDANVEIYAVKRKANPPSVDSINADRRKRNNRVSGAGDPGPSTRPIAAPYNGLNGQSVISFPPAQPMEIVNDNVSTRVAPPTSVKPRKTRNPPKKRPVSVPEIDVWEKLAHIPAPLSMKEWIVRDKKARAQFKEGMRYLDGRPTSKGKQAARGNNIGVLNFDTYDDDNGDHSDSDSDATEYNTDDSGTETISDASETDDDATISDDDATISDDDDDKDTVYDYPYKYDKLTTGSPLTVIGTIHNRPVKCVIDTGAVCSLISRSLAEELGLVGNGDSVYISTVESTDPQRKHNKCQVTDSVPIRIGDKLRPEHMLIKDDKRSSSKQEPIVLLGMTWLRQYDIIIHPREALIEIPVKNGGSSVMIQGYYQRDHRDLKLYSNSSTNAVSVNMLDTDEVLAVAVTVGEKRPAEDDADDLIYHVEAAPLDDQEYKVVSDDDRLTDFQSAVCYYSQAQRAKRKKLRDDKENELISSNAPVVPILQTKNLTNESEVLRELDSNLLNYSEEAEMEEPSTGDSDPFEERLKNVPPALADFLRERKMQFAEYGGLGCLKGAEHTIRLKPGSTPVRSRPYRLTWEEDEYLKKELKAMLDLGIIRPSKGVWTSPIFFIKKKGGKELRLVYDLRALNARTIPEEFPIPNIHELLEGFQGCRYFTLLDASSGFTQIKMAEDSIEYTGFVCKYGTWELTRMPFGCLGGPFTYSRHMARILGDQIGKTCQIFIDDVCCMSRTLEEHIEHLKILFDIFEENNLKLKWSKCEFAKTEIEYLGHIVNEHGIMPSDRNVEKLEKMVPPTNASLCKSFLATVGFYRRGVPMFAEIAAPLTDLLKKGVDYVWGEEQQRAFDALKNIVCRQTTMAFPDREQVQILTTDASSRAVGVILSQSPDGSMENESVIAFASRTLRGAEKNYSATHLEAFAVMFGVNYFRHYLAGKRFILRTDHSALKFIFNNMSPSPKIQRWAAALMGYDFEIKHIPGRSNPADALSRILFVGVEEEKH